MRYLKLIILMIFILTISPQASAQMPVAPGGLVQINPPFEGAELIWSSATILAYNWYGEYRLDVVPGAVVAAPHDLLDGVVHPDTVVQIPTRGSIVYGNATPLWDELVIGAADEVLISDGVDIAWGDVATVLDEDNVIYVSKIGNDANPGDTPYSAKLTIQAAITQAAADGAAINNRFTVMVYPGVYAETLTMADFVDVEGYGGEISVEVTGVNQNPLITMSANSSYIKNIGITMAPTAVNATAIGAATGVHRFRDVIVDMTSATNGIECRILNMDGGDIFIDHCFFEYNMSGSAAGVLLHQLFDIAGTSNFSIRDSTVDAIVNDVDDGVVIIEELAGAVIGETVCSSNIIHLHLDNAAFAGAAGIYYAHGDGLDKQWDTNHMHMTCDGNGAAYVYTSATNIAGRIDSINNHIEVEGFATNFYANIGANDILRTGFDTVDAVSGWVGAGTFILDFAEAHGDHYINGAFQLQDGTEAAGEILTCDANGVGTWQPLGAVAGTWAQLAENPQIVAGADYTARVGPAYATNIQDVVVKVTCRSYNGSAVWNALSHPTPVADMVTYYWIDDGSGNIEVHICNDSQQTILCTISYADL